MYAVIMAGGSGTRFWPISRKHAPKQFSSIVTNNSMLRDTIERVSGAIPYEKIIIVAGEDHRDLVLKDTKMLPKENVLLEPMGRNTAPCIAYAARWIYEKDKNAKMFVLPADHVIEPKEKFIAAIERIDRFLDEHDVLLTLGIPPTSPHTGYGYIELGENRDDPSFHSVRSFTEKPDRKKAEGFIKNGNYFWNAGMFAWRIPTILEAFQKYMPNIYEVINKKNYESSLRAAYPTFPSISIDYGIMEKAQNVVAYSADFSWSDIGSFDSLYNFQAKDENRNAFNAPYYSIDTHGVYVKSKKFVATIGIDDIIVVDSNDALLLCKRGRSEEIKKVVEYLRERKKELR